MFPMPQRCWFCNLSQSSIRKFDQIFLVLLAVSMRMLTSASYSMCYVVGLELEIDQEMLQSVPVCLSFLFNDELWSFAEPPEKRCSSRVGSERQCECERSRSAITAATCRKLHCSRKPRQTADKRYGYCWQRLVLCLCSSSWSQLVRRRCPLGSA